MAEQEVLALIVDLAKLACFEAADDKYFIQFLTFSSRVVRLEPIDDLLFATFLLGFTFNQVLQEFLFYSKALVTQAHY